MLKKLFYFLPTKLSFQDLFRLPKIFFYFPLKQHNSQTTRVNDVYFNLNQHIYACSDDGSILEWNFSESKLVR